MSSNKFLQRFEGKIHIVGKGGIVGLFGDKDSNVTVYTNNNFYQNNKYKTSTSLNKARFTNTPHEQKPPLTNSPQQPELSDKRTSLKMPSIYSKPSGRHSYLGEDANPLNEQVQGEKRKEWGIEKYPSQQEPRDIKRTTNYNSSRSLQKRREEDFTKSGGLGANIGGEQWMLRKKKLDKMQLFSQQVKQANTMPKLPKQKKSTIAYNTEGGEQP